MTAILVGIDRRVEQASQLEVHSMVQNFQFGDYAWIARLIYCGSKWMGVGPRMTSGMPLSAFGSL